MTYEEKMTTLHLGEMGHTGGHRDVALWSVSPPWHQWTYGNNDASIYEMWNPSSIAYDKTIDGGVMILWLPMSSIHEYPFDPDECQPWTCCGTIISGSKPLYIGYVYRRGGELPWKQKVISDVRLARASSSSKTIRFMLDEFVDEGQTVVEPYAHRSAVLPVWCRRNAISYVGYCKSQGVYDYIVKKLAQVELPGIQLALPTT